MHKWNQIHMLSRWGLILLYSCDNVSKLITQAITESFIMSEANAAITSIATTKAMATAFISDHHDTFKMPVY